MRTGPSGPGTMTSAPGSKSVSISRHAPQGGHHGELLDGLVGLGMANGHGALHAAIAFQDGAAERHGLGADREAARPLRRDARRSRFGRHASARLLRTVCQWGR